MDAQDEEYHVLADAINKAVRDAVDAETERAERERDEARGKIDRFIHGEENPNAYVSIAEAASLRARLARLEEAARERVERGHLGECRARARRFCDEDGCVHDIEADDARCNCGLVELRAALEGEMSADRQPDDRHSALDHGAERVEPPGQSSCFEHDEPVHMVDGVCPLCNAEGEPAPDDETRALHQTTDAREWARVFCSRFGGGEIDEGLMIVWFANAIEATRDIVRAETEGRVREECAKWHDERAKEWQSNVDTKQGNYLAAIQRVAAHRNSAAAIRAGDGGRGDG